MVKLMTPFPHATLYLYLWRSYEENVSVQYVNYCCTSNISSEEAH